MAFSYSKGTDYIRLYATGIDYNKTVRDYSYFCHLPGEDDEGVITTDASYRFDDLTPNTTYIVNVYINYKDAPADKPDSQEVTTLPDDSGGGSTPDEPDEPDEPTWELSEPDDDLEDITDYRDSLYLEHYILRRYTITFKNSGTATFYTKGNVDTYGYLSTSKRWTDGKPNSSLEKDDDAGDDNNFRFTYEVNTSTTYYLWVKTLTSDDYGRVDVYIEGPKATTSSFSWTDTKTKGGNFNLTAVEWNRLTKTINEIRDSKFLDLWDFTTVKGESNGYTKDQSTEFTADIYNEVVDAINNIPGYRNSLSDVEPGDPVTAGCLNDLKDIVNEIIENG